MTTHRYWFDPTPDWNGFKNIGDSWSLWVLDDETRTVFCTSDFGNWTFMWGKGIGRPKDFREELFSYSPAYITQKLSTGLKDYNKAWLDHIELVTLPRLKEAIQAELKASKDFKAPVQPLTEALRAFTGREPPACTRGVKALHELSDDDYQQLQDWASDNARPDWSTGIGLIEAAERIIDAAIENNNIEQNPEGAWIRT